jgi:diacylglycerol kinase family enzyme
VRILVVGNPRATAMSARQRDVLAHALGGADELQIEETANRGHAAALACRAMRSQVDVVVALGGDGTVNEIVNGLLTDGVHDRIPALGIVPAGSTNVFARALGLPNDPIEATGALLEALRAGRRRRVSVGRLDERWFVFAAGVGFDAAVIAGVERLRQKGRKSTIGLYTRVTLREFFRADRRRPQLHIDLPDGTVIDDVYMAVVANADPWTYVGQRPLRPTPEASLDGGLELYARTRMGVLSASLSMVSMARRRPRAGIGSSVTHDLPGLVIRADSAVPIQVDGDLLGDREKIHFRRVLEAISVIA